MARKTREITFRKYTLIFLVGLALGGYVFKCYIQTYINECKGHHNGKIEKNHLFVAFMRLTTDPNETGVIRRLITSDKVHANVFCTNLRTGDIRLQPRDLHHIYDHRHRYEWFVLTANVIVDADELNQLLTSLSRRAPVALVHPDCSSISVLVVNQATLLFLSEHQVSGHTAVCEALQEVRIHSLYNIWRRNEIKHTTRNHDIKYNFSLVFPLHNDDLHNFLIRYQQQRINHLRQRLAFLNSQMNLIPKDTLPAGVQSWNPLQSYYVHNLKRSKTEWSFINKTFIHSLYNYNAQPTEYVNYRGRQLVLNISQSAVESTCSSEPKFVYQRVDVGAGVVNIVVHNNVTCQRNYKAIYPFEGYRFQEEPKPKDTTTIILLPLFKRSAIFGRFIRMLHSVGLDYKGSLTLQVVLYKDKSADYKKTLKYIKHARGRVTVNVVMTKGKFSRSKAVVKGLERLNKDVRVLIMDVDMMFTVEFLERVVKTTIRGKQAFFPIPFSRYAPQTIVSRNISGQGKKRLTFSEDLGRWRFFSYGIVGIYKSDVMDVGNFDTYVKGWGAEDVFFYEKCVTSHLSVFRSVDLGLWHMYHSRNCDPSLTPDQLRMCLQSKIELESSQQSLATYVLRLIH